MRIDHLTIKNFRCFEHSEFSFHPQFNLIVGVNGSGKTALLDALSVSLATWLTGFKNDLDKRVIEPGEPRLATLKSDGSWLADGSQLLDGRVRAKDTNGKTRLEKQYPVEIDAKGEVMGKPIKWLRSLHSGGRYDDHGYDYNLVSLAETTDRAIRAGELLTLPLIAYYGTRRLPQNNKQVTAESQVTGPEALADPRRITRFEGYRHCVSSVISVRDLINWFARQAWIAFQEGEETPSYRVVRQAVLGCLENATELYFEPKIGELLVTLDGNTQPFSNLSDGQRCVLAMVADIAQKAEWLNPHLRDDFLINTPGVVLIDELDLHLHPKWQRRIIEDLLRTFPKIQFICTTHSPQLIGEVKPEEIIFLRDGQQIQESQSFGMDSNWILKHIMGSTDRNAEVAKKIDNIFELIEEDNFNEARKLIDALRAEIGEHPSLVRAETIIDRYTRIGE
jgi:predicted ATP-binding protein involved in virulence